MKNRHRQTKFRCISQITNESHVDKFDFAETGHEVRQTNYFHLQYRERGRDIRRKPLLLGVVGGIKRHTPHSTQAVGASGAETSFVADSEEFSSCSGT